MELSIRTSLEGAQVEGDGAVVVPGRLLVDLSRLLPDSEVTLEFREEESVLHVACGPAEYRLNTYGAEDFPRLPETDASRRARSARTRCSRRWGRSAAPCRATRRARCSPGSSSSSERASS